MEGIFVCSKCQSIVKYRGGMTIEVGHCPECNPTAYLTPCEAWPYWVHKVSESTILEIIRKETVQGHYEAKGYIWRPGETPTCCYCDQVAVWATPTSGVYLCDNPQCHTSYILDECDAIEFVGGT